MFKTPLPTTDFFRFDPKNPYGSIVANMPHASQEEIDHRPAKADCFTASFVG
jgi:hypothetical protein